MRSSRVRKETTAAVLSRIKLGEKEEKRLVLMIQFPPPGCRSVAVWRQVKTEMLEALRKRLVEDRRKLAELINARVDVQLDLDLPLPNWKRGW